MASFIDSGKSLTGKSGSKTKLDGSGQGIGKNDIAGLLPDHVDRGDDEETGGKKGDRLLFWRASNVEKLVL
jgi:hypothetical protein